MKMKFGRSGKVRLSGWAGVASGSLLEPYGVPQCSIKAGAVLTEMPEVIEGPVSVYEEVVGPALGRCG